MKIALVVPNVGKPEIEKTFNELCVPFNLLYIAGYLRQIVSNVEIKIFDGLVDCNVEAELFAFQPEIVGVTATTPQILSAYYLGDSIHNNRPDILTVIGGVHASALPEEALKHFDVVVVGEGEKAFARIVMDRSEITSGLIVRGEPIAFLDDLPFPAYDLVDLPRYFEGVKPSFQHLYLKEPIMQTMTSRGCVNHCPYCTNSTAKPKLRFFSPERVIQELVFLHKKYGLSNFFVHDDEFLVDKKRFFRICELAKEQGVDKWFSFVCQTRAQSLHDPTVLIALKELNCKACLIGFESHNERNLRYMKHDSTSIQDQNLAVKNADVAGIPLFGSFIFGSKHESIVEMEETLKWMLEIKHDVGFGLLVPFPGTTVFNDYVGENGNSLDYDKMIMTNRLNTSFVKVDEDVSREEFDQFLVKALSLLRVKARILHQGIFKTLIFHVFWRDLLRYPIETLNILKLHHSPLKISCPKCNGMGKEKQWGFDGMRGIPYYFLGKCKLCKGRGLISKK